MSTYNRKGLAHSRKVITSSIGSTRPGYSVDALLQSSVNETRRWVNENGNTGQASSMLIIRENPRYNSLRMKDKYSKNWYDIRDVKQIPTVFVGISKPSAAIDRLLKKRKSDHKNAVKSMGEELAKSYAACGEELKNLSISIKIEINGIHEKINEARDKLRQINLSDLRSEDFDLAWEKVSTLISDEKQLVSNFYDNLLNIEKKRLEYVKPILQKYYKIFHKISHLMPYEIQVYLENEILNYNQAILGNHRIYADLRLQMCLLTDTRRLGFKYLLEEMKLDNRETIRKNDS